jgi:alkylation response protein AidB-like acyl-CoA dehydrogenase
MDLNLSDEQTLIVAMVRRFVRDEILPLELNLDPDAAELEDSDKARLVAKVKEMGLYGLDIPPEYGGPEIDLVTRTFIAIEMSQHRAGLYAPCYGVFGGAGLAQLFEANDDQKERYLFPTLRGEKRGFFALTEPSGGSDPARAIQTRAVRDGDDWVINGSKIFISGADRADYGLLFARTDPAKGRGGVTCFIVETSWPGFHVRRVFTRCVQRTTRRSCNSKICGSRTPIFSVRSTRDLPSPTIVCHGSVSPTPPVALGLP